MAEANRLFAAWLKDRNAIPGSLKSTWLGVAARNATPGTWEGLHAAARDTQGQVERSTLYRLLGTTTDEALARRALDLALTAEPGKTVSAGIISAVAQQHPALALDFVLSHVNQVSPLIDLSGRSRFVAGLVGSSNDPSLIAKLEDYGKATFKAADRKPIDQAVARIRWRAANRDRIRMETAAWLQAHPQG
jgi:aminopeptidase N